MGQEFSKEDVREITTQRILEALNAGKIPWHRPWTTSSHDGMMFNFGTDKPYNGGINQILLNLSAMMNGWTDSRWIGRGQAKKAGLSIKGLTNEKGTVIFAPILRKFKDRETDESRTYIAGFYEVIVFNAQQIDGAPEPEKIPEVDPSVGFLKAKNLLENSGASIQHGGNVACYVPALDLIQLPKPGQFDSVESYWSTALHELTHWTGADSRLARGLFGKGIATYAFEELVAEMGSAFLCAYLGVSRSEVQRNHEAYIQHWITRLENDSSAFMDAASLAWKAFRFLTE